MKGYTKPVQILPIDERNRMVSVDYDGARKQYAITQKKLFGGSESESDKVTEDVGTALGPWSVKYWNEKTGSDGPEEYPVHIAEVIQKGDSRSNNRNGRSNLERN